MQNKTMEPSDRSSVVSSVTVVFDGWWVPLDKDRVFSVSQRVCSSILGKD